MFIFIAHTQGLCNYTNNDKLGGSDTPSFVAPCVVISGVISRYEQMFGAGERAKPWGEIAPTFRQGRLAISHYWTSAMKIGERKTLSLSRLEL